VTVTESRRLKAADRRLAGVWNVAYEFTAPAAPALSAKVEAIASTPDTFKAAFATEFKAVVTPVLVSKGVSPDVLTAMVVSEVTSVSVDVTTTTTTTIAPGTMIRVTGEVSFSLTHGNRAVVEYGAWKSIAEYFGVAVSSGSVKSTLQGADAWSVTFEFSVTPENRAAVSAKVAQVGFAPSYFKVAFATTFKVYLLSTGLAVPTVNSLIVNGVSATGHDTTGWEDVSGAVRSQTTSAVALLLATLLGVGAKCCLQ